MEKLFVPIETKVREFHAKLLFSLISAEKGFETILGGQHELHEGIEGMGNGIYVDKSISDTKLAWFKRCLSLGNYICSWDEEGLVVFDDTTYQRLRICEEVFDRTCLLFTWGDVQANAVLSKMPDSHQKVKVTGNPRFDMLRPEFHCFYAGAVDKLRREFGRILLVNTNFAFANFFIGEDGVRKVFNAYRISKQPGFFEGWADNQRQAYHSFLEVIPFLSRRYSKHTIVIRPHPSENFDPWHKLSEDLDNVVVNGMGNVHEWILASDVVVHSNCTTGIEAFFLDVPAITYRKTVSEAFDQPLPNALSLNAFSVIQLLDIIDEILEHGDNYPRLRYDDKRIAIAKRHISGMDGLLASERITECLLEIDCSGTQTPVDAEPAVPIVKQIWRRILKLVRSPDSRDIAYSLQKFPGLDLLEVQECVDRFKRITGRFEGISVKKVSKNCFSIVVR